MSYLLAKNLWRASRTLGASSAGILKQTTEVMSWTVLSKMEQTSLKILISQCQCYSSTKKQETIMNVFDRKAKRIQKNRTALMKDYKVYEYLREEVHICAIPLILTEDRSEIINNSCRGSPGGGCPASPPPPTTLFTLYVFCQLRSYLSHFCD